MLSYFFFLSKVLTKKKKEFKKISLDYPGMSKSTPSHILSSETTQWEWILPTNPNYPPHITIKFRSHWANQKPYDHMITVCRANLLANLIWVFFLFRAFYVIGCVVSKKMKASAMHREADQSQNQSLWKISEKGSSIKASAHEFSKVYWADETEKLCSHMLVF